MTTTTAAGLAKLSSSGSSHQSNTSQNNNNIASSQKGKNIEEGIRLRGRVRDEFCCPITRQILKDPIIASDGHTYDRREFRRWLANRNISPKTGEELTQVILPNYNIQRLIRDLFEEGGQGLVYPKGHPCADDEETWLGYENILILQCVGPQENDLFNVSITVYREGLSGGRKRQQHGVRDSVEFKDSTVSRKHFTIDFHEREDCYTLRDEGSAGGTYIRIPYGHCRPLKVGTMILVGKHQFEVIDESESFNNPNNKKPEMTNSSSEMMQVEGGEEGEAGIRTGLGTETGTGSGTETGPGSGTETGEGHRGDVTQQLPLDISGLPCPPNPTTANNNNNNNPDFPNPLTLPKDDNAMQENLYTSDPNPPEKLILRCFGPEGSPIQNREYVVYTEGATVGRKIENNISLSQKNEKDETVAIDSAVSGEHCRILYDEETKEFIILDGTDVKASTNGTWIRLSKAHTESIPVPLRHNDEMLIGGVLRFSIAVQKFLTEKDVTECVDDDITDGETVVGDGSHMVQDEYIMSSEGGGDPGQNIAGVVTNPHASLARDSTTTGNN